MEGAGASPDVNIGRGGGGGGGGGHSAKKKHLKGTANTKEKMGLHYAGRLENQNNFTDGIRRIRRGLGKGCFSAREAG